MTYRSALALLTAVSLAACGGSSPAPAPDAGAATWRVDSSPILDIGADESDSLMSFGHVAGASRQPNGEIIVADRPSISIRTYSADGRFLRAFGKKGSGPGEIDYLADLIRCGDSLYVDDIGLQKYHVYGIDGGYARSIKMETPIGQSVPYNSACNDDGIFIHNGWGGMGPGRSEGPGRRRFAVPYWLTSADGSMLRQIDSFPGSERLVRAGGSGPHPLGKQPVLAISNDRFYIGTADSLAIMVFDLEGNRTGTISKASVEMATTPDDIARYRMMDTLGKSEQEQIYQMREWETFEFPPTVPAYTDLLIDQADNLWVRLFHRAPAETVRWLVFSPSGAEIGSLDLPMELVVHEVGEDYVLGSAVDLIDGTPRVRLYRLHR